MKQIKVIIAAGLMLVSLSTQAQPQKSRVQSNNNSRTNTTQQRRQQTAGNTSTTSRADLMFPTAVNMPEDVTWRRDIYRQLDLMKDENAALYYPQKPMGDQQDLFAVMFRLFSTGKLPVYEPNQSGIEDFRPENRMHFQTFVDKWSIPYEKNGNQYKIEDIDVPSDEVKGFYVKESSYYDQNTATYHTRVTALCPILYRSDDYFSTDERLWPLFWVKMEDIEPFLSQHMLMTSNINQAATMSMADYFATNRYKGKIFMTTNMQGKALAQLYPSDSLLVKEQKRIEKEMTDFEEHIWKAPVDSAALALKDSLEAAEQAAKGSKKAKKAASSSSARSARRTEKAEKPKKEKSSSSSSGSAAPRVSVRRQRH